MMLHQYLFSHNDSLISLFPKGALTGTTLFPNAAPPATSASESELVAPASIGPLKSNDDGGEDQSGLLLDCEKLREFVGIELEELTPSQAFDIIIPTIVKVLQDSDDHEQLRVALSALQHVLRSGRNNNNTCDTYAEVVRMNFDDNGRAPFYQFLEGLQEKYHGEVHELANSIVLEFFTKEGGKFMLNASNLRAIFH